MALGANSYGDTDEIASLCPRRTVSGVFDGSTRPTLTQLESIVDQISGIINSILSKNGFTVPISQATAKLALDWFVNEEAAAIVEGINNAGRFGPTSKKPGARGRFAVVMEDVKVFIEEHAVGFERLGAPRPYAQTSSIGYRGTNESGDAIHPIFQREGFGNVFENWDSD